MRIAFDPQRRFDRPPVLEVRLNTSCRDEIIPILKGLQHIYSQPELATNCSMQSLRTSTEPPVQTLAVPG